MSPASGEVRTRRNQSQPDAQRAASRTQSLHPVKDLEAVMIRRPVSSTFTLQTHKASLLHTCIPFTIRYHTGRSLIALLKICGVPVLSPDRSNQLDEG